MCYLFRIFSFGVDVVFSLDANEFVMGSGKMDEWREAAEHFRVGAFVTETDEMTSLQVGDTFKWKWPGDDNWYWMIIVAITEDGLWVLDKNASWTLFSEEMVEEMIEEKRLRLQARH